MGSPTKKNLWIAAGYSSVLSAGLILGPRFASENQNSKNGSFLSFGLSDRSSKVEKVIRIINENYVDSVQLDTVQDMAIQEILKNLDPHSAYLAPEDAQQSVAQRPNPDRRVLSDSGRERLYPSRTGYWSAIRSPHPPPGASNLHNNLATSRSLRGNRGQNH